MSAKHDNGQSVPTIQDRRRTRKILRIGHSWAVTIPGDWIRKNVDPDNPHVVTNIDDNGAYRISAIGPAQPQT